MVQLLLYADDLILISESAAGLQKQSNVLASFCEQRQLTANLSKTKVVAFAARHSSIPDLVLAEFGHFPLQVHFWQQIVRCHHRTVALDNARLIKLAMVSGCTL